MGTVLGPTPGRLSAAVRRRAGALLRGVGCALLLAACASEPATPPAPAPIRPPVTRADAPVPDAERAPLPPVVALHVEIVEAEAALLRFTEGGDPAQLDVATLHLQAALQHDAGYTYAQLLGQLTAAARGDTATATRLDARIHPFRRHVQARWFAGGLAPLAPYLRARIAEACRGDVIRAQAPGACTIPPGPRPADFSAYDQVSWVSHGESRFETWSPRLSGYTHEEFFETLGILPGQRVADVGAGEGWLALPLAAWVGPEGEVVATDVDPALLELLAWGARWYGLSNVRTVLVTGPDPGLPADTFDVVVVSEVFKAITSNERAADAAHLEADVYPVLRGIRSALRPDGRLLFMERRTAPEDKGGVSPETVRRHAEAVGFRFEREFKEYRPAEAVYAMRRGADPAPGAPPPGAGVPPTPSAPPPPR